MAMSDACLYRLFTWLSPSFPVGAYTYSHGIEAAVEAGWVTDRASLVGWIEDVVRYGGGRSDAVFLAHAWRATCAEDGKRIHEVMDRAAAQFGSSELRLESLQQGAAFRDAVRSAWQAPGLDWLVAGSGALAYPVAVGVTAAAHMIPLRPTLNAYVHGFATNLVSAGLRLIPLGQTDGQRATAALEGAVHLTVKEAETAELDDAGGGTWLNDILSMQHEVQHTRLFRS